MIESSSGQQQIRSNASMVESSDDQKRIKELEKKVRILTRKLKRSEEECIALENASEVRESVLKTVIQDVEKSNVILEERGQELETALTDLKSLQMKLVESEKMSALGIMVAGIAHEINNPVSFIYGNLNYATTYLNSLLKLVYTYQKNYPEPVADVQAKIEEIDLEFLAHDAQKLFQSMKIGAERIREIVRSLRVFSRLDESDSKMADIHKGLESTLTILNHRIKPSPKNPVGINLVRNYAITLSNIYCYPGPLNQVFMNILVNAMDALEDRIENGRMSPASSPTIKITTQYLNDDEVCIQIEDNGPGIPEHIKDKLFDPFFTTKPVGKGTGLGLAISYQIITEKHRGRLLYNSSPGQGTVFSIVLPTRPAGRIHSRGAQAIGAPNTRAIAPEMTSVG